MSESEHFWSRYTPTAFHQGRHFDDDDLSVANPVDLSATGLRDWVREQVSVFGINASKWARDAHLAPSTLNRFMQGKSQANLSATTISALAKALNSYKFDDAIGRLAKANSTRNVLTSIEVIGRLSSEPTHELEWSAREDYSFRMPPLARVLAFSEFAFEIGPFEHTQFTKNDYLIVIVASNIWNNRELLTRGAIDFLVHEKQPNNLVQTSIRQLVSDPHGELWLMRPAGNNSVRAVHLDDIGPHGFSDTVLVSFAIVGSIKTERWIPQI